MGIVKIENVVATSSMDAKLDLEAISRVLEGSEYDPEIFPGLVYRMTSPKTSILLFGSGKVVCTGGKTIDDAKAGINKVKDQLNANGIDTVDEVEVTVQNLVATCDIGAILDLNMTAISLGLERVEYEPEQFPGLVYRVKDSCAVLLLFCSGKIVCTGGKNIEDLEEAVETTKKELKMAGLIRP